MKDAWLNWTPIQVLREMYFIVQTRINTGEEKDEDVLRSAALAREYLWTHDAWFREQFPREAKP